MVLRRACTALLCHRWRVLHCLQALWGFKSPLRPFPRLPLSNGAPWFSVSLRCQQDLNQPPSFLLFFLSLPPASLVQHILSSLFGLMIATLGHSESLPKPVSTSPFVIWILFSCLRLCLPPSLFKPFTLGTSWDRNATKEVDLWLLHLCFLSWLEVTEHLFGDLTSFLWRVSVPLHWYSIAIAWLVWLATGVPCSGPYHWGRRTGDCSCRTTRYSARYLKIWQSPIPLSQDGYFLSIWIVICVMWDSLIQYLHPACCGWTNFIVLLVHLSMSMLPWLYTSLLL